MEGGGNSNEEDEDGEGLNEKALAHLMDDLDAEAAEQDNAEALENDAVEMQAAQMDMEMEEVLNEQTAMEAGPDDLKSGFDREAQASSAIEHGQKKVNRETSSDDEEVETTSSDEVVTETS